MNITWALGVLVNDLKPAKGDSPAASGGAIAFDLGNSFDLRLLIHYVGDIH